MGLAEVIEALSEGRGLLDALSGAFRSAGLLALVLVLLIGLVFFLPAIIASLRHIKLRILVCTMNVAAIALLIFHANP